MRGLRHPVSKFGILFVVSVLCSEHVLAGEWDLKKTDSEADIRVYYRTTDSGYTEFKGITHVKSRLSAFVALFNDLDRMPEWVYRNKKSETLKDVSNTEVYARTVSEMPWPLTDRDAVLRSTLSQDPKTLAVTIRGSAAPNFWPRSENHVRMPVVESYWRFTPLESGAIEVVFQGYGDPGGNLSSRFLRWFVDLALWEAPYQTLLGVQKMISGDAYQRASYAYIREPTE